MTRRCPWCCEPLAWRERAAPACPRCGRPLKVAAGAAVRPIDVSYDLVVKLQRDRFLRLLRLGIPAIAVVALLMPLLHLAAAGLVPLLVLAHLLLVRMVLVSRGRLLLGTARRLFNRWISRLAFLWAGLPGYGLATIPLAGVVAGVATFAGLSALVHYYTLWSLDRERRRLPLALWETLVLWALALATLAVLAAVVVVAVVVGFSVAWLDERLRSL